MNTVMGNKECSKSWDSVLMQLMKARQLKRHPVRKILPIRHPNHIHLSASQTCLSHELDPVMHRSKLLALNRNSLRSTESSPLLRNRNHPANGFLYQRDLHL